MGGMTGGMTGGMMGGTSMMGMCFLMIVGFLLLVIVIGLTIYMVVRLLMRKSKVTDHPLMLLKERYVKGEINEEEYEQKRKVLTRK